MHDTGGVAALGRRLTRFGALLLAGALVAFVWAVGFTQGVEGLLEGMVITVAGFLVPAVALLWIGWVLGNVSQESDESPPLHVPAGGGRRRVLVRLQSYLIAAAAVALALVIRTWLAPYLHNTVLSPTFLLAITVSAWMGGMGPAVLSTVLSVGLLWIVFIAPGAPTDFAERSGDLLGLALFVTVALSIAGIASALRITQARATRLRADVREREAALDESEARFRDLADDAPAMIWMAGPTGKLTYCNRAWREYTGRRLEQELGDGWLEGVHAQDLRRRTNALRTALERKEPFNTEYRLRRHDGTYHTVTDQGRARIDRDGRFIGFLGAAVEVPESVSAP